MGIGDRVREFRERKHWSGFRLAREAGTTPTHVKAIEDGLTRSPTGKTLGKLATALGVRKGHSPLIGFIAGVLLGPFVLLLGLTSPTAKKCPFCAEMIRPEAVVCPKCQRDQPGAGPAAKETEAQRRQRVTDRIRADERREAERAQEWQRKQAGR